MFGYVRPPLQAVSEEEADRFRRMYCGLCHTLKIRYGTAAQFILNYDFTYLAILLSGSEESAVKSARCMVHPIRAHAYLEDMPAMQLAADESVILAYWQLRDGIADHDWLHGLKYRSLSAIMEPAYRKAAALRPEFDCAVKRQLQILTELEQTSSPSIDQAADAFAVLLQSAAEEVEDPVRQRILQQILYHLGRWVYLIDAADDLKKDSASGNYNPVALRFGLTDGSWTPESRHAFADTLDHSIHMMTTAFELWDFGVWTPLLSATFYTGMFQIGHAVLDGTFRAHTRGENRKKLRNVEEIK